MRARIAKWGLAKDEFKDNGHWPYQIYVREARRMVSDFVLTEKHLCGQIETPDSIGMGASTMASHHVQRYVATDVDGKSYVMNEGDVQVDPGGPYQIPYQSLTPKEEECQNLLVPVCLSSSHIAFSSLRMEPVFMILAQSAVTAASIAIDEEINVQQVSYEKLKQKLSTDGQILELQENNMIATGQGINPLGLPGIIVDGGKDKIERGMDAKFFLKTFCRQRIFS